MNKLIHTLFLTLLFFFFVMPIFPSISFYPFAPLLLLLTLYVELPLLLFFVLAIGIFLDLYSSLKMGIHILSYLSTILVIRRYRSFLSDRTPYLIGLFTALISFLLTLFTTLFVFVFDKRGLLFGQWSLSEWLLMPLVDGIYAILWIGFPLLFLEEMQKRVQLYMLQRKRR